MQQLQVQLRYMLRKIAMPIPHKLSLSSAILVNINVMLGAGLFINTVQLAREAGSLGAATYALVALLLLPLICVFMQLVKIHQGGTFYDYALPLHPYCGFLSSWSYFTAKLASCALGIHVFISLIKTVFPLLVCLPTVLLDCIVIVLFMLLNTLNLRIGRSIQFSFIIFKLVPILFVFLSAIFLLTGANFAPATQLFKGVPITIPFVLYAFTGFEASCSLSRSMHDPEKNGPRAILIAYGLGVMIVMLFQLFFFGNLGMQLGQLGSYLEAFPALLQRIGLTHTFLLPLLHIGIAASCLGAAYGIMYSNAWNIYALATKQHIFGHQILMRLNAHHIPIFCVLAEGALALLYILYTQGNTVPLQQINALGMTITYALSTLGLLVVGWRTYHRIQVIPVLALVSCSVFVAAAIKNFVFFGITPIIIFLLLSAFGSGMFWLSYFNRHQSN